ncbi:UNKNOWN [Stylonychia lemnae]|uniref:2,4-diaminopentanoate dehydrogenase C-terminal domain-containing protein n=1 Tax=Stylonychia lemnae TaxID=5949 RepID=A0A077ZQK8_STYLE|nr:UNKNOWN [Stylonychia lemnae]|eukprot:CDW71734.1 UNKNOWN [Stylonychia lemnae]
MGEKIALWGFGRMNKLMMKYLLEKNYVIVTVIGNRDHGKDAGEVAGLEYLGVNVIKPEEADDVLRETRPALCIISTVSGLSKIKDLLVVLARNRVNVLTINEDAFYSWSIQPEMTKEIDAMFRQNQVTFTGAGYFDLLGCYFGSLLVGISHKVDKILMKIQFNLDDFGAGDEDGVGLSVEEFKEKFYQSKEEFSYIQPPVEALAYKLGWKVLSISQRDEPTLAPIDIQSNQHGIIEQGRATGHKAIITCKVLRQDNQEAEIQAQLIGCVYHGDMEDYCEWETIGVPSLKLKIPKPDSCEVTCASTVNRIKDCINARPGYVTVVEMGPIA